MTTSKKDPGEGEGIKRISLDSVLEATSLPPARQLPLSGIGYNLARILMGYLFIVSAAILVDYFVHVPSAPAVASLTDAQLQTYQQLSQVAVDRSLKLFDSLVLKSFLPVLTAVLGYIFGTRESKHE